MIIQRVNKHNLNMYIITHTHARALTLTHTNTLTNTKYYHSVFLQGHPEQTRPMTY